jgi:hypothetical protein
MGKDAGFIKGVMEDFMKDWPLVCEKHNSRGTGTCKLCEEEAAATELANLRDDLARVSAERDGLAQGIGDAVVKAGIAEPVAMTGPVLLLMLQSLVDDHGRMAVAVDDLSASVDRNQTHWMETDRALKSAVAERDAARAALAAIEQSAVELKTRLAAAEVDLAEVVRERDEWKATADSWKDMGLAETMRDIAGKVELLKTERDAANSTLSLIRSAVGSEDVVGAVERLVAERDLFKKETVALAKDALMFKDALVKYGNHVDGCNWRKCSCGLDLALQGDTGRGEE